MADTSLRHYKLRTSRNSNRSEDTPCSTQAHDTGTQPGKAKTDANVGNNSRAGLRHLDGQQAGNLLVESCDTLAHSATS